MLKTNKLNKYYNKNRRNENHVLKDISVDFPEKGLVMLLGDSGSGKTTLLNVIGGLDKADSGSYAIDDTTIAKYSQSKVDKLRNKKVGYIFQNYYLFPHETVYENIRLTLKMIGMSDEAEIERRINHLLKLINMPQYKHRKANQLSGGQQQRIAIIRALAKSPEVIIADEPTGNLDSKNTMAVMRMLKEISKDKLIIMVTHEEHIAKHYGDQIIRIQDGNIIAQEKNGAHGTLDTTTDSDIYLGDLEKLSFEGDSRDEISVYKDNSTDKPLKARLIIKNKTLYIDIDGDYRNVNLLKADSDTMIHDSKREEVAQSEVEVTAIDYDPIEPANLTQKRNVIPIKSTIETTIRKLRESSKLSKFLYLSFAFSAAIFMVALALLFNILFIDEDQFLRDPAYAFEVYYEDFTDYESFENWLADPIEAYSLHNSSRSFELFLPRFYQTDRYANVQMQFAPIDLINDGQILYGRMPQTDYEMVISQRMATELLDNNQLVRNGITRETDILKLFYEHDGQSVNIVGIVDNPAPVAFVSETFIYDKLSGTSLLMHGLYDTTIEEGRDIENSGEILIHTSSVVSGTFEETKETFMGETFTVVGTYSSESDIQGYQMRTNDFKRIYFNDQVNTAENTILLFASNQSQGNTFLNNAQLGEGFIDRYQVDHDQELSRRMMQSSGLFVFSIVTLSASALSFFFIIRSSMLKRIYEIGVYRALGVKRSDVIKLFWLEILIITTFSSMLGYGAMYYVLNYIDNQTRQFIDVLNLSTFTFLSGILMIYLINSVFGLLPLFNLLRKTPAQIHTTYDL